MDVAIKASIRAYKNSRELYLELNELFMELEESSDVEKERIIKNIKYSLNDLKSEYKKIKTIVLIPDLSEEHAKDLEHNLRVFRHSVDRMNKKIMAIEYYDNIVPNINKYILGVIPTLSREEISKYGEDPIILKKKFLSKILAPKKIEHFKLKLNQLIQSTLSQKIFNSIFKGVMYNQKIEDTNLTNQEYSEQFGHPEANKRAKEEYNKFQSLKDYKENKQGTPLMITKQMRIDLSNLGYNKEEISNLKPEQAHNIINKSADSSNKANVKFRKK